MNLSHRAQPIVEYTGFESGLPRLQVCRGSLKIASAKAEPYFISIDLDRCG